MEAKARNCLTREKKSLFILTNHLEGKLYSKIADIVRRSKSTVYRVISRFKVDKTLEPKPRTGRLPTTTKREDRMIVKTSLKDCFHTTTSISCAFNEQTGNPISRKTLWLGFHVANLWFQRKIKRFVLTSPKSISCGQRNNEIWFTLVMNLNSTCLDLMVRGL